MCVVFFVDSFKKLELFAYFVNKKSDTAND